MTHDDERLPLPPAGASADELREYGRQLAMDGLIGRAYAEVAAARGPGRRRLPRRLVWTAAASLLAAAASVLLAVWLRRGPDIPTQVVPRPADVAVREIEPPVGRVERAELADGSVIEVEGGSRVRVTTWPERPRPLIELERGQVTCEVSKGHGRFTVKTPVGEAIALGTRYVVRLESTGPEGPGAEGEAEVRKGIAATLIMTVSVISGEVLVRDLAGREQLALAGAPAVKVGDKTAKVAQVDRWKSGQLVPRLEDGRQGEPLEVRKHSVKVTIREQIAFVEVDQTFYNPSNRRLEGTFYFPLPAGSTICRLAMYVGDMLMEGEIAEAQRARRTFEALLVQQQDPALLEWAGGNNFKMRVFPIEAKSEKRVLISYYQVLKREHGRIEFSYPLASDALQTHKVGKIEISATVDSTPEIVVAKTPGFDAKVQPAKNHLDVSWSAEKVSPERDFVLSYNVARGQGELVTVPYWHARCAEGYFLMIFSPELEETDSEKGKSSRFVFVLDKSGGLGARQLALGVKAVRNSLGLLKAGDQFGIVAYDAFARTFRPALVPANAETVKAAGEWLDALEALGASDLGAAWKAAGALAGKEPAQVVYVGSGLSTLTSTKTGRLLADADASLAGCSLRLHCLALGDIQDAEFLAELARKYSGTVRSLASAEDAAASVGELMDDYAWPLYRDVRLEFNGVNTDEIYPVWFPNVAAGRQLFAYGKYYGQGKARVRLSASYKDKPYSKEFEVDLGGERVNNFVPKLWATRKIEHLQMENALAEGERSENLVRTVIETSKRYRVMSQFTSFIVLETPEDYLRFGIERRRDEFAPGDETGEIADLQALEQFNRNAGEVGGGRGGFDGKPQAQQAGADKGGVEQLRNALKDEKRAEYGEAAARKLADGNFGYREKAKADAPAKTGAPAAPPMAKAAARPGEALAADRDLGAVEGKEMERRARAAADFDTDVLAWARKDIFPVFGPTELGRLPRDWRRSDERALEILGSVAGRFQSLALKVNAYVLDRDGKEIKQGREWLVEFDAATKSFVSHKLGDDFKDVCDGSIRWRLFPTLKYAAKRGATDSDLAELGAALPGFLVPWGERLDRDWLVGIEKREEGGAVVLRLARRWNDPHTYVLLYLGSEKGPVTKIEYFERRGNGRNPWSFKARTVFCEEVKEVEGVKVPTAFRTVRHAEKTDPKVEAQRREEQERLKKMLAELQAAGKVAEAEAVSRRLERVGEELEGMSSTAVVRLSDLKVNYKPGAEDFKVELPKDWAVRSLEAKPRGVDVKPVSQPINPSPNMGGRPRGRW